MLERIAPGYSDKFILKTENNLEDAFEIESRNGFIIIRGNNNNSMAKGLNHYLKNYCKTYISWYVHDKIELPKTLPALNRKVYKRARVNNLFFLNYCTFRYTMPWWQWKDWEHFIDWMALNGINMPLAIMGQEAIWYEDVQSRQQEP